MDTITVELTAAIARTTANTVTVDVKTINDPANGMIPQPMVIKPPRHSYDNGKREIAIPLRKKRPLAPRPTDRSIPQNHPLKESCEKSPLGDIFSTRAVDPCRTAA
ncbi:hypothetical protein AB3Y40_06170 [Yoonia sp. R2331]|uniref:hypothetical protein n=1 Tax=Yoonia sp. R2331 TaxID=3237238 RepID=UPI0034E4A0A3